ncbi:Holliday junction resolvase MOC1, chloroplastic isoform X2 [Ricinus communis]|uniref:Holliday junction resolvase MOC1, chloroplastic isoform X2 n=1 Tax=Ricinus communis TaxID=3988 RepID=UPI00201A4D73|nr:Holliday junction resolvase MOC1, chloroplastic isoform X2 [Ricinus communis]
METLHFRPQSLQSSSTQMMNSVLFSRFKPKFLLIQYSISNLKRFCTTRNPLIPFSGLTTRSCSSNSATSSRNSVRVKDSEAEVARQLKENWLHSLSCPFNQTESSASKGVDSTAPSNVGSNWVIGIDPDLSGALALLKIDDSGCSAQELLHTLSNQYHFHKMGSRSVGILMTGWWSGGFGYGLWIGILVASGFSVVPVPSLAWKNVFELSGSKFSKDDSRKVASTLFPSLSSLLKRKKDHGRAEALLIAAYGKGLKLKPDTPCDLEESP